MPDTNKINHLAIIMDGNLRWSKKHKITAQKGYIRGLNKINEIIDICLEKKIKHLTLYALSTENNKRASVKIIYKIIYNNLNKFFDKVADNNNIKIKIIGETKNLPNNIIKILSNLETKTIHNKLLNVNIAFNYGANIELLNIIKKITNLSKKKKIIINEKYIKKHMYLSDTPDPDLLIRTGGEKRLSNFIMYNLTYTEIFFIDTLWPDFSKKELLKIINTYKKIQRRYGL